MTNQGFRLRFRIDGRDVIYIVFAILALTNSLADLQNKLFGSLPVKFEGTFFSERIKYKDKFVLWIAMKEELKYDDLGPRLAQISALYANRNGAIYLNVTEISSKYTDLYWEIVNSLPETDREWDGADNDEIL